MNKKWTIILSVLCFLLINLSMVGPVMSKVEQPKYIVLSSDGNMEMRKYSPMIIAEVEMKGARDQSIRNGFRILADYIFGNNVSQKTIAMTTPVRQQLHGEMWTVSFVMPAAYSLETLPQPKNEKVKLKQISAKYFLAIRFSGAPSDKHVQAHQDKLMLYVQDKKFKAGGTPKYAFYNPPWTLPFMRRNEVMIEVDVSKDRRF